MAFKLCLFNSLNMPVLISMKLLAVMYHKLIITGPIYVVNKTNIHMNTLSIHLCHRCMSLDVIAAFLWRLTMLDLCLYRISQTGLSFYLHPHFMHWDDVIPTLLANKNGSRELPLWRSRNKSNCCLWGSGSIPALAQWVKDLVLP